MPSNREVMSKHIDDTVERVLKAVKDGGVEGDMLGVFELACQVFTKRMTDMSNYMSEEDTAEYLVDQGLIEPPDDDDDDDDWDEDDEDWDDDEDDDDEDDDDDLDDEDDG